MGYTECGSAAAWLHIAVLSRMPQSVCRMQTELYAAHTQTQRAEEEESSMGMGTMNCQLLKTTRQGWKEAGLLYFFLTQRPLSQ